MALNLHEVYDFLFGLNCKSDAVVSDYNTAEGYGGNDTNN